MKAGPAGYAPGIEKPAPTPFPVAARALLRTTVLDAVGDQMRTRDWSAITLGEVAAAGGVSRQTIYNEFGSRHGLAQAYVLREVDRFVASIESAVEAHLDDPPRALSAAFAVFLELAAEHPLARTILRGQDAGELLPLLTTEGEPVLALATARLSAVMCAGWPVLGAAQADLLAECVVRLAISYAALPTGPAGMTADSIATLLGPYVERLLAAAGEG